MTNKEIEKTKQDLYEIQRIADNEKKWKQLVVLAEKLYASVPVGLNTIEKINAVTQNIHIVLQTETMLNACVSAEKSSATAKWACWWAFLAAIVACISVILQNWPWFLSILFLLRGKLKL